MGWHSNFHLMGRQGMRSLKKLEEEEVHRGAGDAGFPLRNKSEFQIQETHTAWSKRQGYFQKTTKFGTLICESSGHFFPLWVHFIFRENNKLFCKVPSLADTPLTLGMRSDSVLSGWALSHQHSATLSQIAFLHQLSPNSLSSLKYGLESGHFHTADPISRLSLF